MLNFTNIDRDRTVRLMFQTQECGTWNIPQRLIYKYLNLFFPTLTSPFKANRGCSAYKKGSVHVVLSLRAGFPHKLLSHTQLPALPKMSHFFFIPWKKLLSLSESFQLLRLFTPLPLLGALLTHPFHLSSYSASSCFCKSHFVNLSCSPRG